MTKRKPTTEQQNTLNNKKIIKMNYGEDTENIFDGLPTKTENLYGKINILATDGTLQTYCSWFNTTVKTGNTIPNFNFSAFCIGDHFSVIEKSIVLTF